MTGERSKIRSGEFLVFRSRCRCACVWLCPSKNNFLLAFMFAPDQKYSLSREYMLLKIYVPRYMIEFSYAQSNNFSRKYIVIGTRYFVTQTGQHGVATV